MRRSGVVLLSVIMSAVLGSCGHDLSAPAGGSLDLAGEPDDVEEPAQELPAPLDVAADVAPADCPEGEPGGFGCPCAGPADCASGFCVQGLEQFVCTETCIETCPDGWRCIVLLSTCPDCTPVCVPEVAKSCAPCQFDVDCIAGRCLEIGGQKVCADPCDAEHPCPDGLACTPSPVPDDTAVTLCLPKNGTCDCTSANAGTQRPCSVSSELGYCLGLETCDLDAGWVGCTATTPAVETCNGLDDDCDGSTDELLPETGTPCQNEVAGLGSCGGALVCDGAPGWRCDGPAPAAEACNGQDDDCDGEADEPYLVGGLMIHDEHCGSCDVSCAGTVAHGTAGCEAVDGVPTCVVVTCDPGWVPVGPALCAKPAEGLCESCLSDADCPSWQACTTVGAGTFCTSACGEGQPGCPPGFACAALEGGSRCLLASGGCGAPGKACSYAWECEDLSACTKDACSGKACAYATPGCEDGNLCTSDGCDAQDGCTHSPLANVPCDDGDPCTLVDTCAAGKCAGSQPMACDDGLACTADACQGGVCTHAPAPGWCHVGALCVENGALDPAGPCRVCNSFKDPLAFIDVAAGTLCEDGDVCTSGEKCQLGTCVGGTKASCADTNPCTDDACDPKLGCAHAPNQAACNDGKFCTVDDVCSGGQCGGAARDCTGAGGACTVGLCDEAAQGCQAVAAADATACDDGQQCTGNDQCTAGACQGAFLLGCCKTDTDCADDNPCTKDWCETSSGACLHAAAGLEGAACDDGEWCTVSDACKGGACTGAPRSCAEASGPCALGSCDESADQCEPVAINEGGPCPDEGNPCTDDLCQLAACAHPPNAKPCDDGKACTFNDTCGGGACNGTVYGCDDGLPCTSDACDGKGGCATALTAGSCLVGGTCRAAGAPEPGNPCLVCDPAKATSALSPSADGVACATDGNPCTADTCAAGACVHPFTTMPCDDQNPCTQGDMCGGGQCAGTAYQCNDGLVCTADVCDGKGGCAFTPQAAACVVGGSCYGAGQPSPGDPCLRCDPAASVVTWTASPDGTACSDGNACTDGDACTGGKCAKGGPKACNDANPCTDDACAPTTGCVTTPNTLGCADDGNPCTDDLCQGGACGHPGNAKPCNDGNACTKADVCAGGGCAGQAYACDDGVACTQDACDGMGGCVNAVAAGFCLISGACVAGGTDNPASACQKCDPAVAKTGWTAKADGTGCSDGLVCTGPDACAGGFCGGPSKPACCTADKDCDDKNPCTSDTCAVATGLCTSDPAPQNGKGCDDGKYCTVQDACQSGTCSGAARDCGAGAACTSKACDEGADACLDVPKPDLTPCADDGNVCTTDACKGGVCSHPFSTAPCNDGNLCTSSDVCAGGACAGKAYSCNDSLACTTDTCNGSGGCTNALQSGWCVIAGACVQSLAAKTGDPCLRCDPVASTSAWSASPDGTACTDNNACTTPDACTSGACKPGAPKPCDDGNACTNDGCNTSSGCTTTNNSVPCADDGNLCTNDLCQSGSCAHPANSASCDDGKPCTYSDYCSGGACTGVSYTCNDGLACTTAACNGKGSCTATIQDGSCVVAGKCYTALSPNPANACQLCDPTKSATAWSSVADGTTCSDANACTENDACAAGACKPGTAKVCTDGNPCTTDTCYTASGCAYPATGGSCDDGSKCTTYDFCSGGQCTGTNPLSCADNNPCTDDGCAPATGCTFTPNGATAPCYSAPAVTKDKGPCKGGTKTCLPDGSGYGPCVGEVTPLFETCANPADEDCAATADEVCGTVCTAFAFEPCYTGPAGTEQKGRCRAGYRQCWGSGLGWTPCMDEMKPLAEDLCGNGIDDDCDGVTNDEVCTDVKGAATWVDHDNGDDTTGNGSYLKPYKTLTKALVYGVQLLAMKADQDGTEYPESWGVSSQTGVVVIGVGPRRPLVTGAGSVVHCYDCVFSDFDLRFPDAGVVAGSGVALSIVHNYRDTFRNMRMSAEKGIPLGSRLISNHHSYDNLFIDVVVDGIAVTAGSGTALNLIDLSDHGQGVQLVRVTFGPNVTTALPSLPSFELTLLNFGNDSGSYGSSKGLHTARNVRIAGMDLTAIAPTTSLTGIRYWNFGPTYPDHGVLVENNVITDIHATKVTGISMEIWNVGKVEARLTGNILGPFVGATSEIGIGGASPWQGVALGGYSDAYGVTTPYDGPGWCAVGCITADPLFASPATGDLHLKAGSPCIDTGSPALTDPNGSKADMGVHGGPLAPP